MEKGRRREGGRGDEMWGEEEDGEGAGEWRSVGEETLRGRSRKMCKIWKREKDRKIDKNCR